LTVLNKRDRMRRAFLGFDPMSLAKVVDIEQSGWLEDSGLIRHRGKLNAMVTNARLFNEMMEPAHFFGPLFRIHRCKIVGAKDLKYPGQRINR